MLSGSGAAVPYDVTVGKRDTEYAVPDKAPRRTGPGPREAPLTPPVSETKEPVAVPFTPSENPEKPPRRSVQDPPTTDDSDAKTPAPREATDGETPEAEQRGRELYEERRKLLAGLWMNDAPDWQELPEDVRQRWRRTAGS